MSNIYTYDHVYKLFISTCDIDHDMAADLQMFLKDKDQKWLKLPPQAEYIELLQIQVCYLMSGEQDDISIKTSIVKMGCISQCITSCQASWIVH